MKNKIILIVGGEPNSIFLEIFFKTIKKNNFKNPIIIIVSKDLLLKQMKHLGFNFQVLFKRLQTIQIDILKIVFLQHCIF